MWGKLPMSKGVIVIPTCRDLEFLNEWRDKGTDVPSVPIIVVEDKWKAEFKNPEGYDISRYTRTDIEAEFKHPEIIPFGDGGIKSFGIWKAYEEGYDYIIGMDDDVYPTAEKQLFVEAHRKALEQETVNTRWFNQIVQPEGFFPRGFPTRGVVREKRPVVLNMGLWDRNPDLGATEFFKEEWDDKATFHYHSGAIPNGQFFCLSAMNMAFKREIVPAFYQGLMGDAHGVYRYDDVWAGMFLKKIADHLHYNVKMGGPIVDHRKKSNIKKSLQRELPGMMLHEQLWPIIDKYDVEGDDWATCYIDVAGVVSNMSHRGGYLEKMGKAMQKWAELF